jgi:hypothetical protein
MRTVLLVTFLAAMGVLVGTAQAAEPLDAYKAYLGAASKASSPEVLFPFISADFKSILQTAPKAEVEKMLKGNIATEGLTDLKVTSQNVEGDKAVLEMTAKTADGRPTTGKATLVKEGGNWKVDEDAWATPLKK